MTARDKSFTSGAARAALAVALLALAAPALAQQPATAQADAADNGEIIVTAQKRAENVQDVPLAVSVVSTAQLQAAGVRNFQDLGKVTPSLTIRPAEHPVNSNVSLRGVGTFAFGIGVESSVAVLVDDVPLAFQARAFTDLPDVERIEVLRGPQSALYGKAASAGLINIITRKPTDSFRIRANAVATTDSEYGANVSLSGPLGDKLGYVISGSYSNWDGNVRNLANGKKVNGRESGDVRGKLQWDVSDASTITLSGNYLKGNTTVGRPFIRFGPSALLRGTAGQTPAVVLPGVVVSPDNTDISNNYDARTSYEGGGGNIRGEFGIGDHTLISITSYDRFKLDDYLDQDDTSSTLPIGSNIQVGRFNSRLFTQEVRLQSPGDKDFSYTVGAYYQNLKFDRPFQRGPAFSLANWFATSKSEQIAGFVQADWRVAPKLTLTGGARLQNEKISYTFLDKQNGNAFFSGSASDTAATGRASVRYDINDDVNAFVTYSTGYKGQTYDLTTGFNNNRAAAGPIRPERSRDLEIGFRAQFLDRKVTFNVTYFNSTYKDLQAQTIETLADGTANFRLTNVGKLGTKGLEIDTIVRPNDIISVNASAALLDAKYLDYPVAQCYPLQTAALGCTGSPARQNLTGDRAIQAPKFKFSAVVEAAPHLTEKLRAVAQFNWQYQSDIFYVARDPQTFQPAYTIINLSLGVRDEDRTWEVVAFVNNLFDQQYYPSLVNTAGNWGGNIATQALLPRDFRRYGGIRFGINF